MQSASPETITPAAPRDKEAALDAETLRKLLDYDPETGIFRRKVAPRNGIKVGDVAGTNHAYGYIEIGIFWHRYYAHRLAWLHVHGQWPAADIDHKNGRRDDNRISNLRAVSRRENGLNREKLKANTSGCCGVSFHKAAGKFRSYITDHRKQIHLGLFSTLEDAAAARKSAERAHGYSPNHGREAAL
jgi:hypothetical protein